MKTINEAVVRMLLERFGEPIGLVPVTISVSDEQTAPCCDQCGMMPTEINSACPCGVSENDLVQKAPPGGEKTVKALKKNKDVKNPWAVAWSAYNKKHKK